MNVSGGQFGDSSWSRPQEIANPFNTQRGWASDKGVQTGQSHPEYEGVEDPVSWRAGASTAVGRNTAWRAPGGGAHTVPAPGSKETYGSLLMGGVENKTDIPEAKSQWRSASFQQD